MQSANKSFICLILGILSIVCAPAVPVLANLLYQNPVLYFGVLSIGLVLAIIGLYFSRVGIKGKDIHNQNAQTLGYVKAGKICCIVGICFNFFLVIPILWFSIFGIFGP
ncbi:hypothetical protein ABES02_09200 [Neobacillus pocheonensis]|uniref:hypothetical protein n=1 Tax=Neobacillus pocheonensis TaxID=363869 RepID=UPI003D2D714F